MPDESGEVIRIRAVFDGASLRAGLDTGARDVMTSTEKMGTSFKKLSVDTTGAIAPMDAQVQQLDQHVKHLNQELGGAGRESSTAFTEARRNISAVGEEIGVHIPREVAKYIASLGSVAEIADKAFALVGILGMLALLPELGKKVGEIADELYGLNEVQKKLYEQTLEKNNELIVGNVKVRESYRGIEDVGKKGLEKLRAEQENLNKTSKDAVEQVRLVNRGTDGLTQKLEEQDHGWQALANGISGWFDGADAEIKKEQESIVKNGEMVEKLNDIMKESKLEQARLAAEVKAQEVEDSRTIGAAKINAAKTTSEAVITLQTDQVKRAYENGQITLADEVAGLTEAENQKYTILEKSIEKKKGLARSNPDAAAGASEMITLGAEKLAAEKTHQDQLEAIKDQGAQAQKRIDQSVGEAEIATAKEQALAHIAVDEDTAREQYASHKIESEALTQALLEGEDKRTDAERKALQGRLALAQQDAQKNKAQIVALNGQLELIAVQHEGRANKIKAEGAKQQLEDAKRSWEEELRVAEETSNRQLQAVEQLNNARLKLGRETSREWLTTEEAAIETWYHTQQTALQKELAQVKAVYGQESQEYKNLIDRMNQLDLQRQQKHQQALLQQESRTQQSVMKVAEMYNKSLLEMMNGQVTFQQGFERSWNEMVSSMAAQILRGVEQWALSLIVHQTTAEKSILISAKDSAAKAWASAPNPIVGAIEAAATFAAVMAYGSFDRGGIVPNDGFHQLHKKEMVLPAGISTGLQNALGKGEIGGGYQEGKGQAASRGNDDRQMGAAQHNKVVYSPTINGLTRESTQQMLTDHSDHLLNIVRQGYKDGRLS